jgi:predicted TPR repeat methyltransferase
MGAAIRDLADELVGVDLSPGMIMQAQTKDVYDRLVVGNLVAFLEEEPGPFDLVLAADVFVYLEDLKPIISLVRDKLAPGGLLAFTTEAYRGDGVILNQGLRFAHGEKHLREAAKTARLDVFLIERASARTAEGKPVPGSIAVMARRAAQARRSVRRPTRRARSAAQSRRNTSAANSPVRSASSAVPRP